MRIQYTRSKGPRHSKPLFVAVSKFETDSFPVRVMPFRLGRTKTIRAGAQNGKRERQKTAKAKPPDAMGTSEAAPKSAAAARGIARPVPTAP